MKAIIANAGDSFKENPRIEEINTLLDLLCLIKKEGYPFVISTELHGYKDMGVDFHIIIYNNFLES